jgi:hypothetical protein
VGAGSAMEKAILAVVLEVVMCLFVGIVRLLVVTSTVVIGVRLWEL